MTAVAGKLFRIVDCIAAVDEDSLSLATLTKETGLPKATLYRLLSDLVALGVLDHTHSGYSLGGKLFELGGSVPEYRRLRDAATPYLQELSAATGEAAHLGALRNREVLYLERIPGRMHVQLPTSAGARHPLHRTRQDAPRASPGTVGGHVLLPAAAKDQAHHRSAQASAPAAHPDPGRGPGYRVRGIQAWRRLRVGPNSERGRRRRRGNLVVRRAAQ
jgi:IclR helix-turn-helix domain